jgi:putative transposase
VASVFPEVDEQRCWNHRIVSVLHVLPHKLQSEGKALLIKIPYAKTREEAERQRDAFQEWTTTKGVGHAGRRLAEDWDRLVAFYAFPKDHWKHLRTTNVVESPFAAVRLRTAAAKRFKKVENSTAVIWKTFLVAEQHFRRLDAPELLPEVAEGVAYVNGARAKAERGEGCRLILFTHLLTRPPSSAGMGTIERPVCAHQSRLPRRDSLGPPPHVRCVGPARAAAP